MQMRHQPAFIGESIEQIAIRLDRIDGREPQARELGHMLEYLSHQMAELGRTRQVRSVAGEIDAGEDDFAIAAFTQVSHLTHHFPHGHGARIAATMGNDAKGGAVGAAVLHGNEGAHAAFESVDEMRGRARDRHDVVDPDLLLAGGEWGTQRAMAVLAQSVAPSLARSLATNVAPDRGAELLLVAQDQG